MPVARTSWRKNWEIDPIVVDRLCSGDPVDYATTREVRIAVSRLTEERKSIRQIADLLGVSTKTVSLHRRAIKAGQS